MSSPFVHSAVKSGGAAVPSTPGTNRKNLVVNKAALLPTPSFTQQLSASKRKRETDEELDQYPLQHRNNKATMMRIGVEFLEEEGRQWLLASGDVLTWKEQNVTLYPRILSPLGNLHTIAMKKAEDASANSTLPAISVEVPMKLNEVQFVEVLVESRTIVFASASGAFAFWILPDFDHLPASATLNSNGTLFLNQAQVVKYTLEALEYGETFRHLRPQGNKLIALTTKGNIFVVSCSDAESISSYALQRNVGLMAGLLQASAKLFGIGATKKEDKDYIVSCVLPQSSQLLCVGSDVTMWNTFESNGEEKAVYDLSIGKELRDDLTRATAKYPRIVILDACIMEQVEKRDVATMLLLVASSTMHTLGSANSTLPVTLWLYTVELPLSNDDQSVTDSSIEVLYRMKIAENVQLICEDTHEAKLQNPKMFSMPPFWRIFVTWTHAEHHTMMTTQIDALNQKVPADQNKDTYVIDGEVGVVDTHIPVSGVSAINAMNGTDGVCILQRREQQLMVLCPRLPVQFTKSQSKLQVMIEKDKVIELLLNLASEQELLLNVIGDLRNTFIAWSMEDIVKTVQEASDRIVNKSAIGRFWGSTTAYQARADQNKSNEFQLAHRLVQEKVLHHVKLMEVVNDADGCRYNEVLAVLQANHQKLLLSAGLSEAMQDSQYRLDHLEADDESGYQLAIACLSEGMIHAIKHLHQLSLEHLESKGLSAYDQFYANVNQIIPGIECIATFICENRQFLRQPVQRIVRALYAIISILLSAVQRVMEGDQHPSVHILQHAQMRHAFLTLTSTLLRHLSKPESRSIKWEEREGKRLLEFTTLFLQSYVYDVQGITPGQRSKEIVTAMESMPSEWKEQFQSAKKFTLDILLYLQYTKEVFQLSERFGYFVGLFQATQQLPTVLYVELERMLQEQGHVQGSDNTALALKCYEWLEEQHRFAEILSIGKNCEALLLQFLKTRPHLAWMHHIREKEYDQATLSGLKHAQQMEHRAPAAMSKSLLSIAKLSARLHQQRHPPAASNSVKSNMYSTPGSNKSSSRPQISSDATVSEHDVLEAVHEINTDLTLLKIEEDLQAEIPTYVEQISQEKDRRIFDLIQGSLKALQTPDSRIDPERLTRIPAMIVTMLDVAKKRIGEGVYSSSFASMIPKYAEDLWKSVLMLDGDDWITMRLKSEEMEADIKKTTFFNTLDLLKHDILQKTLARELIPITAEQIESLVKKTNLLKKELDRNGNIQLIKGDRMNMMVLNRIKASIELALEIKSYPTSPLGGGSPRSPLMARSPLPSGH